MTLLEETKKVFPMADTTLETLLRGRELTRYQLNRLFDLIEEVVVANSKDISTEAIETHINDNNLDTATAIKYVESLVKQHDFEEQIKQKIKTGEIVKIHNPNNENEYTLIKRYKNNNMFRMDFKDEKPVSKWYYTTRKSCEEEGLL